MFQSFLLATEDKLWVHTTSIAFHQSTNSTFLDRAQAVFIRQRLSVPTTLALGRRLTCDCSSEECLAWQARDATVMFVTVGTLFTNWTETWFWSRRWQHRIVWWWWRSWLLFIHLHECCSIHHQASSLLVTHLISSQLVNKYHLMTQLNVCQTK